jgi:hypothetical protein
MSKPKPHDREHVAREIISNALEDNPRPAEHLAKNFAAADVRRAYRDVVAKAEGRVERRKKRKAKKSGQVMIAAIYACVVGAVICWFLALATSALAEGAWVLWARPCDVRSQMCSGEWQRRQTYEAERWCRAARTVAVNQALTPEERQAAYARGAVLEYQCLPETVDPSGAKGTK